MAWGIDWGVHNLLSCGGWVTKATNLGPVGLDIGGPCSMAKLGLVLLFFIVALTRKWGGEEIGIEFNFWWAIGLSTVLYFLVVTFTGSMKLAMILGLVGMLVGGYAMGMIMPSGDENYGE